MSLIIENSLAQRKTSPNVWKKSAERLLPAFIRNCSTLKQAGLWKVKGFACRHMHSYLHFNMSEEWGVQLTPVLCWQSGNRSFLTCLLEEGRKRVLLPRGTWAHEQVIQRDCSIPVLRETQTFIKQGLRQPNLIFTSTLFSAWGWTRWPPDTFSNPCFSIVWWF